MPTTTKLNLRLPPDVREEAATLAEAQGLSLNAYLLRAVMNANAYWGPKLARQQRERQRVLAAVRRPPGRLPDSDPDDEPLPGLEPGPAPAVRSVPKVGANQPCPCGSGQKYKRCHGKP
jgi:hypothetical protein